VNCRPSDHDTDPSDPLDRESLVALGHSPAQADWLVARSPRQGFLMRDEYEGLLPDLPGRSDRREGCGHDRLSSY
jgi:hypothetical protein